MRRWFDSLCEHIGPAVSPCGAAVYAGVTRAGVYKRMQTGGITAFCFYLAGKKKTLFGGEKKLKQWPLVYIPVVECKAWGCRAGGTRRAIKRASRNAGRRSCLR